MNGLDTTTTCTCIGSTLGKKAKQTALSFPHKNDDSDFSSTLFFPSRSEAAGAAKTIFPWRQIATLVPNWILKQVVRTILFCCYNGTTAAQMWKASNSKRNEQETSVRQTDRQIETIPLWFVAAHGMFVVTAKLKTTAETRSFVGWRFFKLLLLLSIARERCDRNRK